MPKGKKKCRETATSLTLLFSFLNRYFIDVLETLLSDTAAIGITPIAKQTFKQTNKEETNYLWAGAA